MGQEITTRPRYARIEEEKTDEFVRKVAKDTTGKKSPRDINLPDPQKGVDIGHSVHPGPEHRIKGGDDEDTRWPTYFAEHLNSEDTKRAVKKIVDAIRKKQQE